MQRIASDASEFDYIVIGAGSAGCVLASRLSANAGASVLLIEAGGSDSSLYIQMPAALSIPMNMAKYSWEYYAEPEACLDGRALHAPRGKVLGGTSSINGMVYVRGNPQDYDVWESLGAKGWSYADVLPYFRKAESFSEGSDTYRGGNGPLKTQRGLLRNPLYHAYVEAGQQAGYPLTGDVNGFQQEGFGYFDMTVGEGRRWNTANAYITPARRRLNLKIELNANVSEITFTEDRADGVRFTKAGATYRARARREVVLSAGAFNSPKLLMLSGIGPAQELQRHGLKVRLDRRQVGENLMDHLELYLQHECTQPITLFGSMSPLAKAQIGATWLLSKRGLGSTSHFESGAFVRSRAGISRPDIQYHFLPLAVTYDGSVLADRHGYQVHAGTLHSKSRGHVRLRSADPADKPVLRFNYMSHEEDWIDFRSCVRLAREIFAQPAFDAYRGIEIQPGPKVQTDAEIDQFVAANVESSYHPCGTCRMGSDTESVVDTECRVVGVRGLRVVDASIMPDITSGNLNAPVIMIAEKAADMILGASRLAPSLVTYYVPPDWETRQRPDSSPADNRRRGEDSTMPPRASAATPNA